jgi:LAS superfamily LD-carboxypeptidase LdcB
VNAAKRCLEELLKVHKTIEDQQNNEMQKAHELLSALFNERSKLRKECEENAKTLEASEQARKKAEAQVKTLNRVQEEQKMSCVQVQELRARANTALKTMAAAAAAADAALTTWNKAAEQLCTVPSVFT